MSETDNITPFGYGTAPGYQPDGRAVMVLCVGARFHIPGAGSLRPGALQPFDDQQPPSMTEEFWAKPAESSVRRPAQGVVLRTRAEVYLSGSAWTPRGQQAAALRTRVRVGRVMKEVHVVGNRRWTTRRGASMPSDPEPFSTMPLRYENAFGGTARAADGRVLAQETSNPVGRGLFTSVEAAEGQLLPNLYAPGETSPRWRQLLRPACYGAIPPSWQPRAKFAGTYDTSWLNERAPLWPRDLDSRYFCAAAEDMSMEAGTFRGGEPVELDGFSPDGPFRFSLPSYRIITKSEYADRTTRKMMHPDAILIEPDELSVTVYWRDVVSLGHGRDAHLRSIVRLLESWETAPS